MAKVSFLNFEQRMLGLSDSIAELMRNKAPVDTGALKRSIKVEPLIESRGGLTQPISFLEYGIYTNYGTKRGIKATHWIDQSIEDVLNRQMQGIAEAAAQDIGSSISKSIPREIDITIKG